MKKLHLAGDTTSEVSGNIIFFHVPTGEEKEWVEKLKKNDFVELAELSFTIKYMVMINN